MILQSKRVWVGGQFMPLQLEIEGTKILRVYPYGTKTADADYGNLRMVPGFLDIHMHEAPVGDLAHMERSIFGSMLKMGVTTVLGGNCGDNELPPKEYFDELARVSKHQIIWGGNYFGLPPTRCFLIWDKVNISENFTMSMCEYAWTSFNDNAKMFRCPPQDGKRFHPTQKPVALYKWIFDRYAKDGYKILDTHQH